MGKAYCRDSGALAVCNCKDSALYRQILWIWGSLVLETSAVWENNKASIGKHHVFFHYYMYVAKRR